MADQIELSFCKISIVDEFIVEVTVNQDVNFGNEELNEYYSFLTRLGQPVAVLMNRTHSYAYALDALRKLATHENISAMAFFLPVSSAREFRYKERAAALEISIVDRELELRLFKDRLQAIAWLKSCYPHISIDHAAIAQ